MEGAMKSAAQAASKTGAKTTTRVLLRVKRRRPSPTAAAATSTPSTRLSANATADNTVGAPDRIKLALPCMLSALPPVEGSSKKRRKLDKEEEMALILRLDSAASIHNNEPVKKDDNATATGSHNVMCHTPPRRSAGGPIADRMGGRADNIGQGTPPSVTTVNASNNTHANNDTTPTPAPPTKPRRTVMFRKITDLQKRLDAAAPNEDHQPGQQNPSQLSSQLFNDNDYTAVAAASVPTGWDSMGEEKSKWLRIVDVMLKEDDQVSSICSNDSIAENDNGMPGNILGSGQRVRRMRPRPLGLDNDDNAAGSGESLV